ncbi:cytochrome P450 4F12-like isoform X1 [Ptychodera flava]|uniref:cytochrome P450 4F12-like isoform X1 n=2 Tax=Ptychodera flava TaxID=63121 RepID=UPI00396A1B1E
MATLHSIVNGVAETWRRLFASLSAVTTETTAMQIILTLAVSMVLVKMVSVLLKSMATRRRLEKALSCFPGEPQHWLLGYHYLDPKTYLDVMVDWTNKYKYGFPVWDSPFTGGFMCTHPDTVKAITSTTEPKDVWTCAFVKPWLGDGLVISKGAKWKRNRKLLTPGFHFQILKSYSKIFIDSASILVTKWSDLPDQDSIEISQQLRLLTLHSLMKCIFSLDSHCQTKPEFNPYVTAVYEVSDLILKRFFNILHYNDFIYYNLTADGRKYRRSLECLHNYSRNVIKERKAALEVERATGKVNDRRYVDFLDILLSAKDEDGKGLRDEEIQDEVDTFMFAGHDTTASGISWCLYNLAKHPEHQKKCQQEIDEFFLKKGSIDVEWEDLNSFSYLTMCLKESLRITPVAPEIGRQLTKPLELPDGRVFPIGMPIWINIYALHRNVHVWKDPEVYDPFRFRQENAEQRSPFAYVPFSAGPRNCIGQNFAMSEMKIVLSVLLHHFEFSLDDQKPVKPTLGLTLQTVDGLHLCVKKRP